MSAEAKSPKYGVVAVVALAVVLCGVVESRAATIYSYTGLNFTSVTGSAPLVATSDSITGFVEFATEPTPNETGKNDWIAFSLSDGARTLSSASGDEGGFLGNSFNFDAFGNIIDWSFGVVPDGEVNNANWLVTRSTLDLSRLDAGSVQDARNSGGGTWAAVPEPSGLLILMMGMLGLAWRTRRA